MTTVTKTEVCQMGRLVSELAAREEAGWAVRQVLVLDVVAREHNPGTTFVDKVLVVFEREG